MFFVQTHGTLKIGGWSTSQAKHGVHWSTLFSRACGAKKSQSAVAPTRRKPKLYGFPSDHIFFLIIRGPTSTNGMMFLANTCIGTVNISEIQQEGIESWDLSKNISLSLFLSIYIYILYNYIYIYLYNHNYIYIYLETQLILLEVEPVPNNSRSQPGHSFSPESACLTQLCIGGRPGGANCWRGAQDKSLIRNVQSEICTSGATGGSVEGIFFRRTVVFPEKSKIQSRCAIAHIFDSDRPIDAIKNPC